MSHLLPLKLVEIMLINALQLTNVNLTEYTNNNTQDTTFKK